MAKEFPPSDVLGTLNLFDGLTPVVAPDGHHVFYKKGTASPLSARSLDGDITNNPEESLVTGCVWCLGSFRPRVASITSRATIRRTPWRFATSSLLHAGRSIWVRHRSAPNSDGLSGRPASRLFHGAARQRRVDARHLPLGGTVTQRPPVVKAA